MWLVQVLSVIALAVVTDGAEVCYAEMGCFTGDPLPKSPGQLPLEIFLYTRQNKVSGTSVQYNDKDVVTKLNSAQVNLAKKTVTIIHGFGGFLPSAWMTKMKDELLKKDDFNVMLVSWKEGAKLPDYSQAAANMRVVAAQIEILFKSLQKGGLGLSKVHLIGHSLGAQLCGEIGRRMGGSIGRITGLDPAGPQFAGKSTDVRLDKSDAIFVDVIHTDGGDMNLLTSGLAVFEPVGHVDFYPNGGKNQPGCYDNVFGTIGSWFGRKRGDLVIDFISCSHSRSRDLFIESINSDCLFTAYPCANYDDYEDDKCESCANNGCNDMGYPASPSKGKGSLYLETESDSPFCQEEDDDSGSSWLPSWLGKR